MRESAKQFFIHIFPGIKQALFNLAIRIVSIFLLSLIGLKSAAQPTLPDISGFTGNGTVQLTWNCQYEGIKTISVLRSADSTGSYKAIGNVGVLRPGVQVFTDIHPLPGQNFYKLSIRFRSGLNWNSNHFGISVADTTPRPSVQEQQVFNPQKQFAEPIKTNNHDKQISGPTAKAIGQPPQVAKAACDTQALKKAAVSLSFDPDTARGNLSGLLESSKIPTAPRQKIIITYDDSLENSATLIRSRFIFVDPVSGHINITLPDDVHLHHYSLKFYDEKNKMIIDVPRVNAADIIMDRRNFQKRGNYKFVLRKDALELESGYITVH